MGIYKRSLSMNHQLVIATNMVCYTVCSPLKSPEECVCFLASYLPPFRVDVNVYPP